MPEFNRYKVIGNITVLGRYVMYRSRMTTVDDIEGIRRILHQEDFQSSVVSIDDAIEQIQVLYNRLNPVLQDLEYCDSYSEIDGAENDFDFNVHHMYIQIGINHEMYCQKHSNNYFLQFDIVNYYTDTSLYEKYLKHIYWEVHRDTAHRRYAMLQYNDIFGVR